MVNKLWLSTVKLGCCNLLFLLGKCKTLWGECEQAMHYSIDCYVAKEIFEVHTQGIHAWHVAYSGVGRCFDKGGLH